MATPHRTARQGEHTTATVAAGPDGPVLTVTRPTIYRHLSGQESTKP